MDKCAGAPLFGLRNGGAASAGICAGFCVTPATGFPRRRRLFAGPARVLPGGGRARGGATTAGFRQGSGQGPDQWRQAVGSDVECRCEPLLALALRKARRKGQVDPFGDAARLIRLRERLVVLPEYLADER